jgi:hypothetical protein
MLDFGQFAKPGEPGAGKHFPVAISFDQQGGGISKPGGVTPVDLTQLSSLFGALGGSPSM